MSNGRVYCSRCRCGRSYVVLDHVWRRVGIGDGWWRGRQSSRWWRKRVCDTGGRRHRTVLLGRERVVDDAVDRLLGLLLPREDVGPVVRILLQFSTVGCVVTRIVVQELIVPNRVVYLHLIIHYGFVLLLIASKLRIACFCSCDERIGNFC